MKFNKILILLLFIAFTYGCKKDTGNYTYHPPTDPTCDIGGGTFPAVEGDSLILTPRVTYPGGDIYKDLTYQWDILYLDSLRTDVYTGYPLKMLYNLPPGARPSKLTITVKSTGIKYFYTFTIMGATQYGFGSTVLSDDNGVTKLSFVLPDNKTIQSNIYNTLNKQDLPANAIALYPQHTAPGYPPGIENYWVLCDVPTGGAIVDASTLVKKSDFSQQFLAAPNPVTPGSFEDSTGITNGLVNNKLYIGITSTAPFAPDFAKFGNPQAGNYMLSSFFTQNKSNQSFFGFDLNKGAFVSFDGGGNYNGSDYQVVGSAFDPTNTGMHNLIYMHATSGTTYAFLENGEGNLYEYSFVLNMYDYNNRSITPTYKRLFPYPQYIMPDTKWQSSIDNIFYFTSNNTIYRYNPLNSDLRALNTSFITTKITMLKLSGDNNTLTVGANGSIYFLNVKVGQDGSMLTEPTISGIPGNVIDMVTQ